MDVIAINNELTAYIYTTEEAMAPNEEQEIKMAKTTEIKGYIYPTEEAMAPPPEEEEREEEISLLQPGRPVNLPGYKFAPIDHHYIFTHLSNIERMGFLGKYNPIRNINLYTVRTMRGIGSIINLQA